MRKIVLATAAAAALAVTLGAARADEPGAEKYFHERGNFDASMRWKGPAPDLAGWPANQGHGYTSYGPRYVGPAGYGPGFGTW